MSTSGPSDCCALFCSVSFYLHGERPGRVLGAVGLASVSSSSTVVVCAPYDTCSITALRSNLLVALGKWADVALSCRVVPGRVFTLAALWRRRVAVETHHLGEEGTRREQTAGTSNKPAKIRNVIITVPQ